MIHMGFIELMNMMCLVEFSLTLFNVYFTPLVGKIVSAAWTFDWWMLNFITLILALNRSDVMIGFLSYCFTNKGKEAFFKTILYISYVISFAVFVIYMIPGFQAYNQGLQTETSSRNTCYAYKQDYSNSHHSQASRKWT
uniref:Uncharacterized protein n=1 Tax=Acrobeloides nanus TaxID=290746 RepID=A0A914CVD0_9BILA